MNQSELMFVTQIVDEKIYGAWWRRLSPLKIEVMAIGLREIVSCTENGAAIARSTLEKFVRLRASQNAPVPSLGVADDSY